MTAVHPSQAQATRGKMPHGEPAILATTTVMMLAKKTFHQISVIIMFVSLVNGHGNAEE